MMRRTTTILAVAAAAFLTVPSGASANRLQRAAKRVTQAVKPTSDASFIKEAAQGGMAEVDLGRIGVQRAESPEVKQFAQRMIDDHGKANDELKQVASKEGVALPKDVDAKHKATMNRLSKLSGRDFDRAYMRDMVSDHDHDVAAFEHQAKKQHDPDLTAWIDKTLPTLKEHQQLAQDTANKVGATVQGKVSGMLPGGVARHPSTGSRYQGEASR